MVRAIAKLRGLSGRAEAASALAETEIALKSMPPAPALRLRDADLVQARQLLKLASEEFRKQDYDGTVYAFAAEDGRELWRTRLRARTNACPAVVGDTLLVGAGVPRGPGSVLELVAYRLPD